MLDDVDVDEILIPNKVSSSKRYYKYFISYKDDDYEIKVLYVMIQKPSPYIKSYDDETKYMFFLNRRWWIVKKT